MVLGVKGLRGGLVQRQVVRVERMMKPRQRGDALALASGEALPPLESTFGVRSPGAGSEISPCDARLPGTP